MRVFVTGGTGFIGSPLVRQLVNRGCEVVCLVRSAASAQLATDTGASPAWGDVLKPETLWEPMAGSDMVIHLAGLYRLGESDWKQYEATNVKGTEHVMKAAVALNIPRIVYISSVAIFGDTHRLVPDEKYHMPIGQPFVSSYDRSKWLADQKVIRPLVMRGAPIISVIPSAVFGPKDPSLVGQLMRYFLQGWLVLFPGPETLISLTYIDDAVNGILLAAFNGQPGSRYILSGETLTLEQASHLWMELTGWPAPRIHVPARLIHRLEWLARILDRNVPGWPEILTPGAIRVLGTSYTGRADRARHELGWQPQPLEVGMRNTLAWLQAQPGMPHSAADARRRQISAILLFAGLAALPFGIKMSARREPGSRRRQET